MIDPALGISPGTSVTNSLRLLVLRKSTPLFAAMLFVGLALGGLLVGYEPVGGDPDLMYRPIKSELVRALRRGTLPFWSDRFGLGAPLMAESHVAALYPPNWLFYGQLDVPTAYRWLMWLHFVALAGTTYLLARDLHISPWGAAISSVSFTFCGFMAVHVIHEPFYCILPYLPLALWTARRYVATGRRVWQAGLALTLGLQLTLGHFQIQAWTIGLTLILGAGTALIHRGVRSRALGVIGAVFWGLAIAAAQLTLTAELIQYAGHGLPVEKLYEYALAPAQWAQPALPRLFMRESWKTPNEENYWTVRNTSVGEACWYVGTVPLILGIVGLVGIDRARGFSLWKVLIALGIMLAFLPLLEPKWYSYVLQLPVFGHFRAPARYSLLASLGLALLAGAAVDRSMAERRFRTGVGLAAAYGIAALVWGIVWSRFPDVHSSLEEGSVPLSLGMAVVAWGLGLSVLYAWRRGRVGPAALFLLAAGELGLLFFQAPAPWGWSVRSPQSESPILRRLGGEEDVGLIAGVEANNLPVYLGLPPGFPYLGIAAPPPSFILQPMAKVKPADNPEFARWARRFGISHGIYRQWTRPAPGTQVLLVATDPVLDRLCLTSYARAKEVTDRRWRLERYSGAFPAVRLLLRARVVEDWPTLFESLTKEDHADEATYLRGGDPPEGSSPRATRVKLVSWNGSEAVVDHNGTCDMVVRRGYYPGWQFQVNDGPEQPVLQADGGLRAVRLYGAGPSRIRFRYRSAWWLLSAPVSLAAALAALFVLGRSLRQIAT